MRRAPRVRRMFSRTARYSRASSNAEGLAGPSSIGSTWIHSAWPVPGTAVPMVARLVPRTTMPSAPPGSSPTSRISETTPTEAYLPSTWGTSTS